MRFISHCIKSWRTVWGLHFYKETDKIYKNSLFLEFLAYLYFVAWLNRLLQEGKLYLSQLLNLVVQFSPMYIQNRSKLNCFYRNICPICYGHGFSISKFVLCSSHLYLLYVSLYPSTFQKVVLKVPNHTLFAS